MSTVIAFPADRSRPAGRIWKTKARSEAACGPVVVILPVVRIERHDEGAPELAHSEPALCAEPGSRKAR